MMIQMAFRAFGAAMLALGVAGSGFTGDSFLEEPLVTDRPDFTESSSTVGRGVLQLDVRAARRLTGQGLDLLLGAGLSWRLGG